MARKKKTAPGESSGEGRGASARDKEPPERLPFNETEWAALDGWWAEGEIDRLLQFAAMEGWGFLVVHDLGFFPKADKIHCELVERSGVRLIYNVERVPRVETSTPVFEYRLRGDVLELKRVLPFDLLDADLWDLDGTWRRVRIAEPGAAPDTAT